MCFSISGILGFSLLSVLSFSCLFLSSLLVSERHNASKPEHFTCKTVPLNSRLWVIWNFRDAFKRWEFELCSSPLFPFPWQCSALVCVVQGRASPVSPPQSSASSLFPPRSVSVSPVWALLLEPKSGSGTGAKPSLVWETELKPETEIKHFRGSWENVKIGYSAHGMSSATNTDFPPSKENDS